MWCDHLRAERLVVNDPIRLTDKDYDAWDIACSYFVFGYVIDLVKMSVPAIFLAEAAACDNAQQQRKTKCDETRMFHIKRVFRRSTTMEVHS
jgi:hypothetical protein